MIKISIVCVGKIKEKFFRDAIEEYSKRLGRYTKLNIIEVTDEMTPDGASAALEDHLLLVGLWDYTKKFQTGLITNLVFLK